MMSKYKMICLDIDGTLLNSNHQISETVKETIKLVANRNHIPIVLVSARMPKGITFLQKELDITAPIICYSGALILDETGSPLGAKRIDIAYIEQIYEVTSQWNLHMSLYKDDQWYVESMDAWAKQESKITNIKPTVTSFATLFDLWKKEGSGPNKILCMAKPKQMLHLKATLQIEALNIYPSKPTYLEIMPKMASKTSAIQVLQDKFGVHQSEIIAMGDNYNDIDMLAYAGLGIAMGNAPDEVRKQAKEITLTNDEDGVAAALLKYVILE
jgi:Cof subfamily protein (haloacid dehalogenase superfamily)